MTGPGPALPGVEVRPLPTRALRCFTVDVEDWFHANFRSAPRLDTSSLPRRVEEGTQAALELLARWDSRATFFILGEVAREHPSLVRRIAAAGHEVACHGLRHALLAEVGRAALPGELRDARARLADLSGQPVVGFRAPSWSLTRDTLWALDVLAEQGFRYDSSLFPAANYLYGVDGAPTGPSWLRTAAGATLAELPPSTVGVGRRRLGVGGGFYLRLLPLAVHLAALHAAERAGRPFLAYTHPRELDPGSFSLELPLSGTERVIHRLALGAGARRMAALAALGGWHRLDELLHGAEPPRR